MRIIVLAVGKTDRKELQQLIDTYVKRLTHYIKFEIKLLPDIKNVKHLSVAEQKKKEGETILKEISTADVLVLLDERGRQFTSKEMAASLQTRMNSGIKNLVFVIGGPYGFSDAVYQKASQEISLSKMTFSHQMIRLFFVEQLYRAFTILKNEPYHHQ